MWWRRAPSVIRRSRDLIDHAWADYELRNLEILSSWTMDQPKLETKPSDFWLSWMERHHIWLQSEVISKLREWMDIFQMIPKAICAEKAVHHPHDMQAFYRMHNVKRLPTGPHTPWPNRVEMGVRLFKKFLSALVDTASEILDETTLSQITPAQFMRKAATVRNTQVTLSGKTFVELAMGRRSRDFMVPASMNPEQLTSTPTKHDLLNEKIQKLAMKTHVEVQQRENIH